MKRKQAGAGQLDVILDGIDDEELRVEYHLAIGPAKRFVCEICRHPISAEESRAYGIGYDCAADLGRQVWGQRRRELMEERARRGPGS